MSEPEETTLQTIQKHLEQDGFDYHVSSRGFIGAEIYGDMGLYSIVFETPKEPQVVKFIILGYLKGKQTANPELYKALLQVNHRFLPARFSRDDKDGEVRVECSFPIDHAALTFEQFRHALASIISVADEYYPVFQRIIWVPGMTAAESFRIRKEANAKETEERRDDKEDDRKPAEDDEEE